MEDGVRDGLQSRIPLAVENGQREVLQFRQDDAVLVVRPEKVADEIVVFEPWDKEVRCLRVPLVPIRHIGAKTIDGRPLAAEDEAE